MNLEEVRKNAHALEIDKVFGKLETNEKGLSKIEAEKRLERFGPNDISDKNGFRALNILFRQFTSPLILILILAGVISLLLNDLINAGVIFGAVFLNAAIGFYQEIKASNVMEELRKVISYESGVIRDERRRYIDSKDLVVGDVIYVKQGQRIPADARLISINELKTNEAVFTGESSPVEKISSAIDLDTSIADRTNMVFLGTYAEEGDALAVVVATGVDTELGKITELVHKERKEDVTPLEIKLSKLARTLAVMFIIISAALFGVGVLTGIDTYTMFITAVAVAVAAIPEGLPVAVGVSLAIGSKRILEKKGLIRKKVAAEALGNTTVIASDKTATLTEGRMTLSSVVDFGGKEYQISQTPTKLLELLVLNTDAYIENPKAVREEWKVRGRPMDRAIVSAAQEHNINKEELDKKFKRLDAIPFSSKYKYSAILNDFDGKRVISLLGAPEVILERTVLSDEAGTKAKEKLNELTSKGFRVLALAAREIDSDEVKHEDLRKMEFLAFAVFSDPIRKDVKQAIATAKQAGLRTIIITGDHMLTARYVAKELGILKSDTRIIEGKDLGEEKMIVDKLDKYDVYARVSPDEKVKIIKALKEKNERVAVIGDGINDGPALLRADIGVAIGSGTDVAKEASDLVLLNDSFSIIVEAIKQGRLILENIKKIIVFLISDAFTEIILLTGSILGGYPLALLPAQILWVNLLEDGLPAIALAFEKDEAGELMKRKPKKDVSIFDKQMKQLIIMFTIVTDLVLLSIYFYIMNTTGDVDYARTMIFLGLGIVSLFYVYSVRNLSKPFWKTNMFSNHFLNFSVLFGLFMYVVAIYWEPARRILNTVIIDTNDWLFMIGFALFNVAVIEVGKKIFMKR